jgi:hypothetical protein
MKMISLERDARPEDARAVIDVLDTDGETTKVAQFQA